MKDFKELTVWVKARALNKIVYRVTSKFPAAELYGITSQMRRSSISIAANIAEGCGRRSDGELERFCKIARGSAFELECHTLLAWDLGLLSDDASQELQSYLHEVQRVLTSLVQTLSAERERSQYKNVVTASGS